MTESQACSAALNLLTERSRDALISQLTSTLDGMGSDEMASFLADVLLTSAADRDQLKLQVASLLASRFGSSSEKSSPDQLALFAKMVTRLAGDAKSVAELGHR